MSDLISRSELMKCFILNNNGNKIPEVDCDNFPITLSIKEIKDIIRNQPTAYDVDKVLAKLEKKMTHSFNQRYKAFAESIVIVREGGIK